MRNKSESRTTWGEMSLSTLHFSEPKLLWHVDFHESEVSAE